MNALCHIISSGVVKRSEGGVAGEERLVGEREFYSFLG